MVEGEKEEREGRRGEEKGREGKGREGKGRRRGSGKRGVEGEKGGGEGEGREERRLKNHNATSAHTPHGFQLLSLFGLSGNSGVSRGTGVCPEGGKKVQQLHIH